DLGCPVCLDCCLSLSIKMHFRNMNQNRCLNHDIEQTRSNGILQLKLLAGLRLEWGCYWLCKTA
ncbi:hypothetical protein, partial [Ferrovum sp.]|uniref:hypothetical protein n=1 Tax=Ferrovum sp. TaxID=2609467 RepID=UPI002601C274